MNMSADTPRENLTLTEADPCRLPSHRWRRRPRAAGVMPLPRLRTPVELARAGAQWPVRVLVCG